MAARQSSLRIAAIVLLLAAAALALFWYEFVGRRARELSVTMPASLSERAPQEGHGVLAVHLEIPWSLGFLPDGRMLLTERPGRVRLLHPQTGLAAEPLLLLKEVHHEGEGGLLGLAVHPRFADNQLVYLYYTYGSGRGTANKVVSYRLENDALAEARTIIEDIPGARFHNGGRIRFGPDALLYIATGDAGVPEAAQDRASLAGKILRLHDDGAIPADNPFADSPIYSYGHRNPQGLAWDGDGRLWATEHGPRGHDEINLIEAGKNYGWPVIQGDARAEGMEAPVLHSGSATWAPSGADVLGDSLYIAGLRGRALYRFNLDAQNPVLSTHLDGSFGRLRTVLAGPGGLLYILTSNRDGRTMTRTGRSRICTIRPGRWGLAGVQR